MKRTLNFQWSQHDPTLNSFTFLYHFQGYSMSHTLSKWAHLDYASHIVVVATYVFYYLIKWCTRSLHKNDIFHGLAQDCNKSYVRGIIDYVNHSLIVYK